MQQYFSSGSSFEKELSLTKGLHVPGLHKQPNLSGPDIWGVKNSHFSSLFFDFSYFSAGPFFSGKSCWPEASLKSLKSTCSP